MGDGGTIVARDAGWKRVPSPTSSDLKAVSERGGTAWAVGQAGTILQFGGGWRTVSSGASVDLEGISALDASHAWAVGWGETIAFYDGGRWRIQHAGRQVLRGVFALDANHVWAVGSSGTILFYDGRSWSRQESPTNMELNAVYASGPGSAWAVGLGGTILRFDGAWREVRTGDEVLRSVARDATGRLYVVGYSWMEPAYPARSVLLEGEGEWREEGLPGSIFPTGLSIDDGLVVVGLGGILEAR